MSDVAINGNFIRLGDPTLSFHNFGTPAGAHVLESCSKGCVIACFYFTQSSYLGTMHFLGALIWSTYRYYIVVLVMSEDLVPRRACSSHTKVVLRCVSEYFNLHISVS